MKKALYLPRGNVFPFLLLVVVALRQAKDVDASQTPSCTDAATVLGEGDVQITANATEKKIWEKGSHLSRTVYLWPEEGFRGIGMHVDTGNVSGQERVTAWFSRDSLFTAVNTTSWWALFVDVQHYSDKMKFYVILGDSGKECFTWVTVDNLLSLEVVGYGPSRWRATKPPPDCPYQEHVKSVPSPQTEPTCTAPPPTLGVTLTTIGVVVAVVVAVAVVMVVVMMQCRKQRRSADENVRMQGAPSANESEVVENSLYETLENTSGTVVVENSLYETFENVRMPR